LFNTVSIKTIGGKYYAAFDLRESSIANIELYNIAGQIVKPTIIANVTSNNVLIDTNNLQTGVYFIKVVVGDKIVTKKVFID
jgi:Secretion system C-terminal sorting domain